MIHRYNRPNVNADPVAYARWQWDINHGRLSPVHKPRDRPPTKEKTTDRLNKEEK